jgi:flagellar biosynthesis activator protein FlaF
MYKEQLAQYAKMQRMTNSPREIEAEALTLAANKLIHCRDNWDTEERKTLLDEALKFNQRLWSIFQANLVSKENLLPNSLKLNMLKLSSFVDKNIFQIKAYPSPERLTSIIEIDLSLAEGLRKKPAPAGTKR